MIFFISILAGCSTQPPEVSFPDRGITFHPEIARTALEMERGLMNRTSAEKGMLFIFDTNGYYYFWMRDTLIPLDMIFMNGVGQVVDVIHAEPCTSMHCETYTSIAPARFVLEIESGIANQYGITPGDGATIKYPLLG